MNFKIYTDGGFSYIESVGSWAFVILDEEMNRGIEMAGVVDHHKQTSQVAEIMAILKAMEFVLERLCKNDISKSEELVLEIFSDSQYCVNTINQWMHGWAKKRWEVDKQNLDLWKRIHNLKSKFKVVAAKWVKGHSGIEYNERVDFLNQQALKEHLRSR